MTLLDVIKKHSGKYILSSSTSAVINLFMMKYYTNIFSVSEFGTISLYLIVFQCLTTIMSLDIYTSFSRLYFDYVGEKRKDYVSTIFWFFLVSSFVTICVGLILMPTLSNWISNDSKFLYIIVLFSALFSVYFNFFIRIFYIEHLSDRVLKYNISQSILNHSISFIFIGLFKLGVIGRLLGQMIGLFVLNPIVFLDAKRNKYFNIKLVFNIKMLMDVLRMNLPITISSIQGIALMYADRFFLKHFIGNSAVGIYTLAYMLGQGFSMIFEAISQAILPKIYNDMKVNPSKTICEIEKFAYKYFLVLSLIIFFIMLFSSSIISIISNDSYSGAANALEIILIGFMVAGFYKMPIAILNFYKITWFYPYLSFISFIIPVVINFIFIPKYGIMAAAFSSFIGFYIHSSCLFILCSKYMTRKYNYICMALYISILILVILRCYFVIND